MSLQVWLPLNGNIENQGLSNIIFTNNGATVDNNGKIGQCYSFNNTTISTTLDTNFKTLFSTSASIAFWIKLSSSHSAYAQAFTFGTRGTSWNNIIFGIDINNAGVPVLNSSTSTSYTNCSLNTAIKDDQWHHIIGIFETNILKIYLDGVLKNTVSTSNTPGWNVASNIFIGGNSTEVFKNNDYLNDIRLYNHALSQKEIKEISKALILHYTLDDFALKNNNIMPNYLTMNLGSANPSTGTWRLAGTSNMSRDRVQITDSPYGNCYGFQNSGIQTANDGSCYGIDSFPLEANTTYTISMFARITEGTEGYAGYNIYSATYNGGSWTKVDKNYYVTPLDSNGRWTRCWLTFTTNAATTRNIYIGITTGSASVTTQMCCIRIEKGIPNFNVIYDSSGYCRNGDQVYAVDTTDTPRYSCSTTLWGTTVDSTSNTKIGASYIRGFCPMSGMTAITIAWWGNIIKYGRGGILQIGNTVDPSESPYHTNNVVDIWDGANFKLKTSDGVFNFMNSFPLNDRDNWHYHVITYDGATAKYYCDGIVLLSQALTGTIPDFKSFSLGITKAGGVYRQVRQKVSDFRIYATALSESDVYDLYEVKASVDHNSNFWSYEFQEVDS